MHARVINTDQQKGYRELVAACGTVFNAPEWIGIYGPELETLGIFNDNDELIGTFNTYTENKFGVKFMKTPPFSPHIGLAFINPAQQTHQRNTFSKKINQCVGNYLLSQKPAICFMAMPPSLTDAQDYYWMKFNVGPNYTYRLALNQSEEELRGFLSDKKRNAIKKALKDGVTAAQSPDHDFVKKVAAITYERKSKTLNDKLVSSILEKFAGATNSFSFTATYQDKPAAVAFCIHDSTTAYYLLGGYNPDNKHNGAGALAIWSAILHAKKIGLAVFDFEGSMLPEVEENFREFGGDLVPYQVISRAGKLMKLPLQVLKPQLF